MALTPTRLANSSLITASLPVSLVVFESAPLGLPRRLPSLRLRANASFVRWEIIARSISAERLKAKANTLEFRLLG